MHDGHVGGPKQYNDFPFGNISYFYANIFYFSPPTWPPRTHSIPQRKAVNRNFLTRPEFFRTLVPLMIWGSAKLTKCSGQQHYHGSSNVSNKDKSCQMVPLTRRFQKQRSIACGVRFSTLFTCDFCMFCPPQLYAKSPT